MTLPIDRSRSFQAASATGLPALQPLSAAPAKADTGPKMQRGLGFAAITDPPSVTDVLRAPKVTALARMIRDQADAESPTAGERAAGVALASLAPADKALARLCFFFDPADHKPHLGQRNPTTGDFIRLERAASMKVDTRVLAKALDTLSLEVIATGELKSVPIITAGAVH